jgi:tetratricopeptide (TPR) repeat protein
VPDDENAAQEFFRRVSFEIYRDALTEQELDQLRAATLFSEGLPIPVAALEAAGGALGVDDPPASFRRLVALGLVDDWSAAGGRGTPHAALNALARPLAGAPLGAFDTARLASAAIDPITSAWTGTDGELPFDARGVEAARLGLASDVTPDVLDRAAFAAGVFLFRVEHEARAALAFLQPALAKLEEQGHEPRPQLLRLAADCAERLGEHDLHIACLERGLTLTAGDPIELALVAVEHASATASRDGAERAIATLSEAADLLGEAGDIRSRAITMGKIADILRQRGETDEALRIREEDELPVYERLGDIRERAVTMGKIADILQQRGETDEALRIRHEEQLPVYERLGDIRERAVTMGQIADILHQRGETDEAVRIHREELLPVFKRLGDIRSRAATMGKIADILHQRGETDEALRIRQEDELPV